MKYYTEEHEWCMEGDAGNVWRIGITNFAQDQLGDVVNVELPAVGTELGANDVCGVVESVKSASDIITPVAGKIVGINEELQNNPGLLNDSAEDEGWLLEVEVAESPDVAGFLNADDYAAKFPVDG